MTEVATATVGNPYTQKVQNAFAPLFEALTKRVQHFLTLTNNMIPSIEHIEDGFIVHGLPRDITLQDIQNDSAFEQILHRVKHLYFDGDRSGRTSAQRKLRKGELLENNRMRMYVAYAYTLRKVYDQDYTETSITEQDAQNVIATDLVVKFHLSNIKGNPHKVIEKIARALVTDKEIEEFRQENRLLCANNNVVTIWREMTEEELAIHLAAIIGTCMEEISSHLEKVYLNAYLNNIKPNYIVTP